MSLIGTTAQLEFKEYDAAAASEAAQLNALQGATGSADLLQQQQQDFLTFLASFKPSGLNGSHVKKATVQFSSGSASDVGPSVQLVFNKEGAKLFEDITGRNIGKPLGIFIDGVPVTQPPTVKQKIIGGEAVITGNFTVEEAKKLAISINSGALPIPVTLIQQSNIGPTLGKESVQKSIMAGLVGLSAVILFMIVYYGRLGVIATVGLLIYALISYAIVRSIPIVLTLPGIAGFILSIGMAVDANILIFERIKEEQRKGKAFEQAVKLGFGKAMDAIKDANIATILVAFILYNPLNWEFFPQFGLIRGFALTPVSYTHLDVYKRQKYDSAANSYIRSHGDKVVHTDLNNKKPISPKNVIVMLVKESIANDGYEGQHMLYGTQGKGDAFVFQNGDEPIKATWRKAKETDLVRFYDSSGEEIPMVRGQVWISGIPIGNEVTY